MTPHTGTTQGVPLPATVLVVDDEPVLRAIAERVLTIAGHRVLVAPTAEAARAIAAGPEHIDLLFSDVMMPGVLGTVLAGELRAADPSLRVLLTSGYTTEEVETRGDGPCGQAFLPKPYTPADLSAAIRRLLEEAPGPEVPRAPAAIP